jgi:hypothetical protein
MVAHRHFGGIDRSDHSAFWRHGFKAIMVTDTAMFRNENYHRETDTIETINFEVMANVVASLFAAVVHLGGCYPPAPHSSPCLRLRRKADLHSPRQLVCLKPVILAWFRSGGNTP